MKLLEAGPDPDPFPETLVHRRSWAPTWKWTVATITGVGTVALGWADAGHWTGALTKIAIGLAVQRLVAYFTPNGDS